MLKIKIPVNAREIDADGNLKETPGVVTAKVNASVMAQQRWEALFPNNAKKETLFAYVSRIKTHAENTKADAALVLSVLKAFYCVLQSDDLPDFDSFVEMFDETDAVTLDKQFKVIKTAFELVEKGSAASQKN